MMKELGIWKRNESVKKVQRKKGERERERERETDRDRQTDRQSERERERERERMLTLKIGKERGRQVTRMEPDLEKNNFRESRMRGGNVNSTEFGVKSNRETG